MIPLFSKFSLIIMSAVAWSSGAFAAKSITYYYTDPQGTALATTDEQGHINDVQEFHPFGEAMPTNPQVSGPSYIGHTSDHESGFIYMQARYYDPSAARFVTPDPLDLSLGFGFAFNRFAYAENNPTSLVDYTGLYAEGSSAADIDCEIYRCEISGPGDGQRFAIGLRASSLANRALMSAHVLGSGYISEASLAVAWSNVVQPITNRLKVEIGADILFRQGLGYMASGSYSTGDRNTIDVDFLRNIAGFEDKTAEIHTHPDNNGFSGRTAIARPMSDLAANSGGYGSGDLARYFGGKINGYVSLPNGTVYGWQYKAFRSDVDRHGERELGSNVTTIRGSTQ